MMARRMLDALLVVLVVAGLVAFVAVRTADSACHARRFEANLILDKIALAEKGVLSERKTYDELPLCTPSAMHVCGGKYVVVDFTSAAARAGAANAATPFPANGATKIAAGIGATSPYSFYVRASKDGFIAFAVGTSDPAIGDLLTLDQSGGRWSSPNVCGWW